LALLQQLRETHTRYPRRAQMQRLEGTVMLAFTLDRAGRVLAHRLQRSSGHGVRDDEVEAMLERAQPLPVRRSWQARPWS
jgi:TonB family protein